MASSARSTSYSLKQHEISSGLAAAKLQLVRSLLSRCQFYGDASGIQLLFSDPETGPIARRLITEKAFNATSPIRETVKRGLIDEAQGNLAAASDKFAVAKVMLENVAPENANQIVRQAIVLNRDKPDWPELSKYAPQPK